MKFVMRLLEEVFPIVTYLFRSLSKERLEENLPANDELMLRYSNLDVDKLSKILDERHKDAASLDEKTFKLTLALALALTFLGTAVTALIKEIASPNGKLLVASLVSVSILYILFGGIVALGAMKTQKTYGKATTLGAEKAAELAASLRRQEISNIRRQLRNEAAFQSLRNGLWLLIAAVAAFAVFYIIGLLQMQPKVIVQ